MNFGEFMGDIEKNDDMFADDTLDFNEETGEFTLKGKVKRGTRMYDMIKKTASLQKLNKLTEKNAEDMSVEEMINNVREMFQNEEFLNMMKEVSESTSPSPFSNPFNPFGGNFNPFGDNFSPYSSFQSFLIKDAEEIEKHSWVKKTNEKIHVFADAITTDEMDLKDALMSSLNAERMESLDIREKFMIFFTLYNGMYAKDGNEDNFFRCQKAMDMKDIEVRELESDFADYRIMLMDESNTVYVLYVKS